MCNFDFDNAQFSSVTTPRARKAHRCDECRRAIDPGERYERKTVKFDGPPETWLTCLECAAWRAALFDAQARECHGYTGVEYGALWQYVEEFCREHLGYDPSEIESEAA